MKFDFGNQSCSTVNISYSSTLFSFNFYKNYKFFIECNNIFDYSEKVYKALCDYNLDVEPEIKIIKIILKKNNTNLELYEKYSEITSFEWANTYNNEKKIKLKIYFEQYERYLYVDSIVFSNEKSIKLNKYKYLENTDLYMKFADQTIEKNIFISYLEIVSKHVSYKL